MSETGDAPSGAPSLTVGDPPARPRGSVMPTPTFPHRPHVPPTTTLPIIPPGWYVPPVESTSRVWRVARGLVCLLAVLGVAGRLVVAYQGAERAATWSPEDMTIPGDAPTEPPFPAEWDPRITELVSFVEVTRGLEFEHPVEVRFLSEEDFVALVEEETGDQDPEAAEEAERRAEAMDASGLVAPGSADGAPSTVAQVTWLGFFDFVTESIVVRGDELTPATRATLVHELTHALQEQHFGDQEGYAVGFAMRAVLEGDAMRIEDEYVETLPSEQQEPKEFLSDADEEMADELKDVPWALVDRANAPYILGALFLQANMKGDENRAVDRILRAPPTEEELVTPTLYGSPWPADLWITPKWPTFGAVVLDDVQRVTMFDMLTMLDAWLPWRVAREALDQWGGGASVTFAKGGEDGPTCLATTVTLDSADGAAAFAHAITQWAAASGSDATPHVDWRSVSFDACERGAGAAAPPRPVVSTSEAALMEHYILMEAGPAATAEDVRVDVCIARTIVDDPHLARLFWTETLTEDEWALVDGRSSEARSNCVAEARA
jgi:hypothetical protein